MDVKRQRPGYLSKYAKHAGISRQSAAEKLARVNIDYLQSFDFAEADRRIQAAAHADRAVFSKQTYGDAADDEPVDPETRTHPKFIESQAKREMFKAALIELEYQEKIGKLIPAETVDREWYRIARTVRDRLLNIPLRVAGEVAAQSDQRKVMEILEKEINQTLESLVYDVEHQGESTENADEDS